jgi:HPt (histidine-containing phosphotransfer) domain-containing protein
MNATEKATSYREPDWDKLQAISAEVERLQQAGQWTEEAFKRLWIEALEAVGDEGDELEPLLVQAKAEWKEGLREVCYGDPVDLLV